MVTFVTERIGKPVGRGPEKGYSLGQAMEMHLYSCDFLALEIDEIKARLKKLGI